MSQSPQDITPSNVGNPYPYPVLEDLGQIGFEREVEYKGIFTADFGAGAYATAGSNARDLRFRLTWNGVNRNVQVVQNSEDGGIEDRVRYLWNFHARRMANLNEPFILFDPIDYQPFLVRFADTKLSQRQVKHAIMYGFSVSLVEVQIAGVDPSAFANPNYM